MITKPVFPHASGPLSLGRQIEVCFALWLASARPTFGYSLLYGLAGLMPALTLGDLTSRVIRDSLGVVVSVLVPWLPFPNPVDSGALVDAVWIWLGSPSTWGLLAFALLLALSAITGLIHRQECIARGNDPGLKSSVQLALRHAPASIGAWLGYGLILLLLTLPFAGLSLASVWLSAQISVSDLLLLLLGFVLGSALLAIPLTWAAVAFGFAPFASAIEGCGPLAAQRRSAQLVRGHWGQAALVVTVPLLIYLGLGSSVSSLAILICAVGAYLWGGWTLLLSGEWLLWSQALAALPLALVLPLAFTGGTVCYCDLRARAGLVQPGTRY